MAAEVSPELRSRFDMHSEEPRHREAVLLTSERRVEPEELADMGVDVSFVSRDGRIVAGSLDRTALGRLAQLPGVVRIEPDTQMHALDG